ncbi:DUF3572 domain-containing protein [Paracoccus aminophilus]|uniref:DUF3572 domain-containing protein n=1 Tax=Paracoccus aminophilus JCM 7686 TaxID=1367847 RepID=S5Y0D4_PARAH|nr:DUF3572 domain-containing protein [Paracoccus aminophilus]AGT09180.1 hypothetical protein JCM7686_2099 [Paracoccus aminophilus JCM 7686]
MNQSEARDIADAGFAFVAGDPELVGALLAATGAEASDLRAMASRPEFAVFVLDFLLEADERVVDFARSAAIKPERVVIARAVLGGADPW